MSDARRRALERRAAEGDLDARAAVLVDRVRVGQLTSRRLALAAFLGDAAAARAGGARGRAFPRREDRPARWIRALEARGGAEAVVRIAVAIAWDAVRRSDLALGSERHVAVAALTAASEWVRCPCESHRQAAAERRASLGGGCVRSGPVDAAHFAAGAAGAPTGSGRRRELLYALQVVADPFVAAALVPWALGDADPLAVPVTLPSELRRASLRERNDTHASEALHLFDRLDAGTLRFDHLTDASNLGHAGARAVLGSPEPPPDDLRSLLARIERATLRRAVLAIVARLASTSERHARLLRLAAAICTHDSSNASAAARREALALLADPSAGPADRAVAGAVLIGSDPSISVELVDALLEDARAAGADDEAMLQSLRSDVVPWLLEGRDPLTAFTT